MNVLLILLGAVSATIADNVPLGLKYLENVNGPVDVEFHETGLGASDHDAFEVSAAIGTRVIKGKTQYVINHDGSYSSGPAIKYADRSFPVAISTIIDSRIENKAFCTIPLNDPKYELITQCNKSVISEPSKERTIFRKKMILP